MNTEEAEQRLRAAYAATASLEFTSADRPVSSAAAQRRGAARWLGPAAAVAVVVAAIAITTALFARPDRSGLPAGSSHTTTSATTRTPATARHASAPTPPQHAFTMFIHCGVPRISYAGRIWEPVPPVPTYPGPRPVDGSTTYTGYVNGTLTLIDANTLRFVATDTARPFSVTFRPAHTISSTPQPACA